MNTAIETTATIGKNRQLILDEDLPARVSERVRVIVLLDDDIDERLWLKAAAHNEVFDFLSDESEDIYSLDDGFPIIDEE
jgi:hypothetical protein